MRGISFQYSRPIAPSDPNRMDIACFVGFVPRRHGTALPQELTDWLAQYRWLERATLDDDALQDVPVPIESWESFDQLFAWEQRLDSSVVIRSMAVPDTISITADNARFVVVVNGEQQTLTLAVGDHTPAALASLLDGQLQYVSVRTETDDAKTYFVFEYAPADSSAAAKGDITVFTQPLLGFPRAVQRGNSVLHSYLGTAVRAFFAQGGRKCYVIRMGDPLPLLSTEAQRIAQLAMLLFGDASIWSGATEVQQLVKAYIPQITLSHERPEDWHGADHLLGLSDVSYLCLPDLPELLAKTPEPVMPVAVPLPPEVFVECTPALASSLNDHGGQWQPPCCNAQGYRVWTRVLQRLVQVIRSMTREVHLIASLPLPDNSLTQNIKGYVLQQWFADSAASGANDIRSAFLQLSYPWLKSNDSDGLPGQALPPEGVLAGMLAANALRRGVYHSAAGGTVQRAYDLYPAEFFTPTDAQTDEYAAFYEHLSVFARVPGAIQLISDVTTSSDESYRPAVVSRLMSLIVRAARNQGRSTLFEPMSYATWRAVEKSLSTLLLAIFNAGGLRGRNAGEAFSVQCDNSTMTQNDMDNGRLIANVSFQPSIPVQRIQVALALEQGGQVVLQGAA